MTIRCIAYFDLMDLQKRKETVEYFVTSPGAFGAGINVPTAAQLKAVVNALINTGLTGFSTCFCVRYGVRLEEDDLTGVNVGTGAISIPIAFRVLNGVGVVGKTDPITGIAEGISFRIPGANESVITFDPRNRNAVSTSNALWTALRTALVAIGYEDKSAVALTSPQIAESADLFNGKRSPTRPR